ncbi:MULTISPECIES: SDR family NAD(P)-dependent oxidoreductase [unclassified Mycobacterium]|uniref:SDR family NAD(P)-dependent oxidoreductase n=1 Tax=unclassified Mycobacterium TaxID=2642494 RepID=UPI0029C603AD|nr:MULTISPECIES: SDR family NAD(P)-dependent oxidoreductase [unclassified Mycobacterium]
MTQGGVAVVTGGAQGIGAAVSRLLAERGLAVAILDINDDAGKQTTEELVAAGHEAQYFHCDLTSLDAVRAAHDEIVAGMGQVRVLVNNAGWTPHVKFLDQDPGEWAKIVDINYTAVLNTCFVFAGGMAEGSGIVNLASDAARVGVSDEAVYAGAKAAVVGFSKSLATEIARGGVRVNVVSPGSTRTALLESLFTPEELAKRVRIIPMKRFGEPEDVAATIVFLALDASHVTGQIISVNGGATRVG